jgi:hypothetical protein
MRHWKAIAGLLLASVIGLLLPAGLMGVLPLTWDFGGPPREAAAAPASSPGLPVPVPNLVNFQGLLVDPITGDPVPDGTYVLTFRIFDVPSGGLSLWEEIQSVGVADGLFNVLLGSVTALPAGIFSGMLRYLEVQVKDEPPLAPRQRFVSVPYTYRAEEANSATMASDADLLDSLDSSQFLRSDTSSTLTSGTLTIADAAALNVNGNALNLNANGPDGNSYLNFYDAFPANGQWEYLGWNDAADRFDLSNDVRVAGALDVTGAATVGSDASVNGNNLYLNADGPDSSSQIYFFDAGSPTGQFLRWYDDLGRFDLSDDLYVGGSLDVWDTLSAQNVEAFTFSGDGLKYYFNRDGPSFNTVRLFFYSYGDPEKEYFAWEDQVYPQYLHRFALSDDLLVDGNLDVSLNLVVFGTKYAVVPTSQGERLTASIESPEVWFEDFGSARLEGGRAVLPIDPLFAETVNTGVAYHVFLTPLGDTPGLYVAGKSASSFEVRETGGGRGDVAFDYRIVAKRKGYEEQRLAPADASGSSETGSQAAHVNADTAGAGATPSQARGDRADALSWAELPLGPYGLVWVLLGGCLVAGLALGVGILVARKALGKTRS